MKKRYKRILFILILVFIWITSFIIYGHNTTNAIIEIENPLTRDDVESIVDSIVNVLTVFVAVIGIIMIIWSGIQILASAGNPARVEKGKKILKWSIIGTAIGLAASFIIGIVKELLSGF